MKRFCINLTSIMDMHFKKEIVMRVSLHCHKLAVDFGKRTRNLIRNMPNANKD